MQVHALMLDSVTAVLVMIARFFIHHFHPPASVTLFVTSTMTVVMTSATLDAFRIMVIN